MLAVGWDATGLIINDPATVALHATYAQVNTGMVNLEMGRQCVFITDPPPAPLTGKAITTAIVNVRKTPIGKVLDTLPAGAVVDVVKSEGGWSLVTLTAYVATEDLRKA
jgi:hypothetical protein